MKNSVARIASVLPSGMLHRFLAAALSAAVAAGCAQTRPALVSNPVFIPANNQEAVWERTIDVLHQYQFPVKRENKLDGIIETGYQVGAGALEPWHRDAVGWENRLEGSLQSVRRKLSVNVTPEASGYWVGVEAFKELEDVAGRAENSPGGATFQNHTPLQRDLKHVVGQSTSAGWIPLGRDPALEQSFLHTLQNTCSR